MVGGSKKWYVNIDLYIYTKYWNACAIPISVCKTAVDVYCRESCRMLANDIKLTTFYGSVFLLRVRNSGPRLPPPPPHI